MKKLTLLSLLALSAPVIVSAQVASSDYIFSRIFSIAGWLITILIGIAVVVFFWGVIQYVIAGGDAKKGDQARSFMLYGIIGLTAMVGVWGFVNIVIVTVFGSSISLVAPGIPGLNGFGGQNQDECDPNLRDSTGQLIECAGQIWDDVTHLWRAL